MDARLRVLPLLLLLVGCDRFLPPTAGCVVTPDVVECSYQEGDSWCTEITGGQRSGKYCEPLDGDLEVR